MPVTQLDKGNAFRALHRGPRAFIIANAWDAGSARILAGLGFSAIATSSWASANVYGRRDHAITREQALAHARAIADATDLPVSADLDAWEFLARAPARVPGCLLLDVNLPDFNGLALQERRSRHIASFVAKRCRGPRQM